MEKGASTHKTRIEQEIVEKFLTEHLQALIQDFAYIAGGEGAQAFSFSTEQGDFVIRVSKHGRNAFYKDQRAFQKFSAEVPIPEVLEIGMLDDVYSFVISRKVSGTTLDKISSEKTKELLPQLFKILDSIHSIDVSNTKGYGKWDKSTVAPYESWKGFIIGGIEKKESLFETTFLKKELWDTTADRIKELLVYCPDERYLIHGDYGFNNILAESGNITGVIDWAESMYGDFLFDIAWLSFWSRTINYEEESEKYYFNKERKIDNFKERVLCYKLFISLSAFSFYAYSKQEDKFKSVKEKMKLLLEEF
jgi:hygromycin-B 4-O-kinase